MTSYYDTMQACKKWGHKITDCYDSYPENRQAYCEKCGSQTIFKCQSCNENIRGYYHVDGIIGGGGPDVPLYCHKCGKGYPWKNKVKFLNFLTLLISPLKYLFDSIIGLFKK